MKYHQTIRSAIIAAALCAMAMTACRPDDTDADIETALRLSGNNRAELERVLDHYAGDADKSASTPRVDFHHRCMTCPSYQKKVTALAESGGAVT